MAADLEDWELEAIIGATVEAVLGHLDKRLRPLEKALGLAADSDAAASTLSADILAAFEDGLK